MLEILGQWILLIVGAFVLYLLLNPQAQRDLEKEFRKDRERRRRESQPASISQPTQAKRHRRSYRTAGAFKQRVRKPKSPRQILYQQYLESHEWRSLRAKRKEVDGNVCQSCGSKSQLQVHHIHYPEEWQDTTIDHVVTLCSKCHWKRHVGEK